MCPESAKAAQAVALGLSAVKKLFTASAVHHRGGRLLTVASADEKTTLKEVSSE